MVLGYQDLLDFYEVCNKDQLYLRDFEFLMKVSCMDKGFSNEDSMRTNILSKLGCLSKLGYISILVKQPKHTYKLTEKGIDYLAAKKLQSILAAKAGAELGRIM